MDVSLAKPLLTKDTFREVDRVLREERFLRGRSVEKFEDEFADYVGTRHALAVSSGTMALHLSLQALGVGEGDRVLTTPATFIATANAIVRTGAESEFVDVSPKNNLLDMQEVRAKVEERSDIAAVVPVHLYGYPVDMDALEDAVGDIPIVSDACQAHGAEFRGDRIGSLGRTAAFSFYPSKNMTVAGDGGMVTTNDGELAETIRSLRDVGREEGADHVHSRLGYTARMNTVNAAIGRKQLKNLDEWNERRRRTAEKYTREFRDIEGLEVQPLPSVESTKPAWYMYPIKTRDRDDLRGFLERKGIETGVHYPTPVHLQPPYREMGFSEGDFPVAERWSETTLSLPVHPHLTRDQVLRVIESTKEYFE